MLPKRRNLIALADRGPLRVLFTLTSMPVGGAETLLVNLVRRLNRERFLPEVCCLKERGPLGEELADEIPVHSRLLSHKWDLRVLGRLRRLIAIRNIDALVTVGAGDKMFWGRLAARLEGVPVICSAIHSTGWPDAIGRLNRQLTWLTDAFIAVAGNHARHLVEHEGFPESKVCVIPNGIDVELFRAEPSGGDFVRQQLGIPLSAPVIGIVAALRPEKNHRLFLEAAARVHSRHPGAHFLIVGDGPERTALAEKAHCLGLADHAHFCGTRADIPRLLAAMDVFALTSDNEANPVSILEALACRVPVVATRVGSIPETVVPGETGFLVSPGNDEEVASRICELVSDPFLRSRLGQAGRSLVERHYSLDRMVRGYEQLLSEIYEAQCGGPSGLEADTSGSDEERLPTLSARP